MAGGSLPAASAFDLVSTAAMEPRPDGRGKLREQLAETDDVAAPQWSPGLMAGGSLALLQ